VSAAVQPSLVDRLTAADRRREVVRVQERLEPIVLGMADRYGAEGITASDVIAEAILGGILTGPGMAPAPTGLLVGRTVARGPGEGREAESAGVQQRRASQAAL
jgi:hypothetical protein